MASLPHDARYAMRALRKSPGFTVIAVLCIGLGIGVNTTIFSGVDTMLLKPLPYHEPERLVAVEWANPKQGWFHGELSYPDLFDVQQQATSLEGLAAYTNRFVNITGGDEPEGLSGASITWNLFHVLGVRPILGRSFTPEEGTPGREHVVLLSHGLWQRRFAGDRGVIGRPVEINRVRYTVVGVMPPRFAFPQTQQLWIPMALDAGRELRGAHYLETVGRLKPGVTVAQANREMAALGARFARAYPETNAETVAQAIPFRESVVPGSVRLVLLTMMGAVGFVLLIACANVANLLLSRATAREREIAVRTAIGATRGDIVRQLLTESLMLALAGGALGVALGHAGLAWVRANLRADMPFWMVFEVDRRVLAFTLALSVLTGVVFGLAPALQASSLNLHEMLKDGGRGSGAGSRRGRMRGSLVVGEIALALVLLVGASLMVRTFLGLRAVDPGFQADGAMTTRLYLGGEGYAPTTKRVTFLRDVLARLEATPGVSAAAAINYLPLSGDNSGTWFDVEGRTFPPNQQPGASFRPVTARYFDAMRIPLVAGRAFTEREVEDSTAPVAIVNRALATQFWPGESPLGRRIRTGGPDSQWLTIVGVTPDTKMRELGARTEMHIYLPYARAAWRTMTIVARATGDAAPAAAAVRDAVRATDPALPLFEVATLREVVMRSLWEQTLYGKLFGGFAVIALALASIGIYGVMAFAVAQRTREIGVRMALGARVSDVFRLVLRQGLSLAGLGIVIGAAGAFGVTRVLSGLLFGVSPNDPVTYLSVSLVLGAVALAAILVPARRAMRVDPVVALRSE